MSKDPKEGTGKKPKGSDRRLYTDENPKDTVSIKYATVKDAKDTIKKVKNINKPYARKIQILTVLEQRAKVQNKHEQAKLAKEAKKFLTKEDALKINRAVMDSDKTYDQDLWNKIVELGWTGIRIPEEYQGLGLSHLELCVIAEELGRQLAPVPFSSSVYLFTETLIEFGSEEQKQSILPKLVTGDVIGTLAIAETNSAPTINNISVELKDGKLSGTKIAVPDAEVATHAVVVAKNGDSVSLCVADLNSDDVDISVQRNIDESRGYYSVSFNDANAEIIGDEESGWSNLEKIMDHAAVLFSFEQIGGAQASLDMANTYAKERYAFGRPIGSFQSMKHKLADMYVALTLAKSNSFYGAWALSSNAAELPTAAATARVSATKAFQLCSQENIQTHGGNGFTWEYDCHMFYKRSKVLSLNLGSLPSWREKLIKSLEQANIKL